MKSKRAQKSRESSVDVANGGSVSEANQDKKVNGSGILIDPVHLHVGLKVSFGLSGAGKNYLPCLKDRKKHEKKE